jgi:hypothetical protein
MCQQVEDALDALDAALDPQEAPAQQNQGEQNGGAETEEVPTPKKRIHMLTKAKARKLGILTVGAPRMVSIIFVYRECC